MSETIEDIVRYIRRSQNGNVHTISAKEAYALADLIEAAVKALEADRDNWRRQALDEDARANATHKDSLVVGDMAAILKALKQIDRVVWDKGRHTKEEVEAHRLATEALTIPPRNCDVGTAKKQSLRFEDFCNLHRSCKKGCGDCPLLKCEPSCEFEWAHMPYGKGANYEQK